MASSWASNPSIITLPCRPFAPPRAALLAPSRAAPPPRRFSQCSAIHRNSQPAWEHDSQRPGILFSVCRKILHALVHRVPALGTSSAGRWYIECQPLVHRVPAAGTSIASRWYFNCRPRAIQLPAAGNSIAGRGQCDCQPLAMRLPSPVVIALPGHVAIPRLCLSGHPRQCAAVALFATDGKVGGDAPRGVHDGAG